MIYLFITFSFILGNFWWFVNYSEMILGWYTRSFFWRINQKKDIVYHWECQADGWKSSHMGETSRSLSERAKEHSKSIISAIHKHCTDFHHPLPSITNFAIIDKDPSQITWKDKEAIHVWRLDPDLNRNISKIFIPHCFDHLIGAKPKHLWVGLLSQPQESVEEVAPSSQIPG